RRTRDRRASSPWIRACLIFTRDPRHVGITKRVGRANRRLARACGVPRETDAWIKLVPVPVCRGRSRETGIAREIESSRSIHELRALDAFKKTIHVEDGNLTIGHALRKERLPTQSIVEGDQWSDFRLRHGSFS